MLQRVRNAGSSVPKRRVGALETVFQRYLCDFELGKCVGVPAHNWKHIYFLKEERKSSKHLKLDKLIKVNQYKNYLAFIPLDIGYFKLIPLLIEITLVI